MRVSPPYALSYNAVRVRPTIPRLRPLVALARSCFGKKGYFSKIFLSLTAHILKGRCGTVRCFPLGFCMDKYDPPTVMCSSVLHHNEVCDSRREGHRTQGHVFPQTPLRVEFRPPLYRSGRTKTLVPIQRRSSETARPFRSPYFLALELTGALRSHPSSNRRIDGHTE